MHEQLHQQKPMQPRHTVQNSTRQNRSTLRCSNNIPNPTASTTFVGSLTSRMREAVKLPTSRT